MSPPAPGRRRRQQRRRRLHLLFLLLLSLLSTGTRAAPAAFWIIARRHIRPRFCESSVRIFASGHGKYLHRPRVSNLPACLPRPQPRSRTTLHLTSRVGEEKHYLHRMWCIVLGKTYLPLLVMIISVPIWWNCCHRSLFSSLASTPGNMGRLGIISCGCAGVMCSGIMAGKGSVKKKRLHVKREIS